MPYEYNFLEALLDTHLTLWAFKHSHRNLLFSQEFCHHLKHLNHLICEMHTHNYHSADLRLTLALYDAVYYPFLNCLPYAFRQLQAWPLLCYLCFTYSLKMSCPITISELLLSSWSSVIVSCMSHISSTKTFNIPCARVIFVIHSHRLFLRSKVPVSQIQPLLGLNNTH